MMVLLPTRTNKAVANLQEKIMIIRSILVTLVAPMQNHIANGGEKLLGNASSIKCRPDGRVYISGQMQRHALFSALDRLNHAEVVDADLKLKSAPEDSENVDEKERTRLKALAQTYVSNADGVTNILERDLRGDLGGYLLTNKGDYSGRRTAPLSATPAVAIAPSKVGRDLTLRIKENPNKYVESKVFDAMSVEEKKVHSRMDQALATKEFSQSDDMAMNFFLDISEIGIRKSHTYETDFHLQTHYHKFCDGPERLRRAQLALEATASLTDYANQARNATSGEPQKVLIVFDSKLSRKAARYFTTDNEVECTNILAGLQARGATCFLGDDTQGETSVDAAYTQAMQFLTDDDNSLYDPAPHIEKTTTTEEFQKQGRAADAT